MKKNSKTSIPKNEEEWQKKLNPQQFYVLRKKGTEIPFTGKYLNSKENGTYTCAGCGNELFTSDAKYESGTGWPSFRTEKNKDNIEMKKDNSLFMKRIEIKCKKCGGHLGHVFDDGPKPECKRFCINSAALDFKKKK